jgi:hypothetical protein
MLHPFAVYHLSGPENSKKDQCVCFCVISNCLQHTASTVHSFICCIMHHLASDVLPKTQ